MDQIQADKVSIERKLRDAEMQLKTMDDSHRPGSTLTNRKSVHTARESDDDDDEDSKVEKLLNRNRNGVDEDDEQLSDTDSDVMEMQRTVKEIRQARLQTMSLFPTAHFDEKNNSHLKTTTGTIDLSKLSFGDVAPVNQSLRTIYRSIPRTYDSFETPANQMFNDTGRWSNTMLSTLTSTNPLLMYQTTPNLYQTSKTNQWGSQPSLVTREAVLKAARKVFAPSVIDQLNSHRKSYIH